MAYVSNPMQTMTAQAIATSLKAIRIPRGNPRSLARDLDPTYMCTASARALPCAAADAMTVWWSSWMDRRLRELASASVLSEY